MKTKPGECKRIALKRVIFSFQITLFLWCAFHFGPLQSLLISFNEESCHLRELELCAVGAGSLFQNPNGIPIGEAEFKRQCEYLKESADCFENYHERCLTKGQGALVSMFTSDTVQLEHDFCTNGTELKNNYMKHATCLRKIQKKYQRTCVTDLQVGFEAIHKLNATTRLATACCNANRLMECILPRIEDECGSEAADLISGLLQRAVGSMVSVLCRNYDPFSESCRALLPEVGAKPHNGRNTSVISRIISTYATSLPINNS